MKVVFASVGWEDYEHWCDSDIKTLRRLNRLIRECHRTPFKGAGMPEPLRNELAGWGSRRITQKDRLVYRVVGKPPDQALEILQCKGHY